VIRALAIATWFAAACGPRPGPSGVTAADAIVYIDSSVGDAQVYVDGRLVAPLSALRRGIAVEPGEHRFELRHDDYFSSYLELQLARAERRRVVMAMSPILP
jgi:hypothetical protein